MKLPSLLYEKKGMEKSDKLSWDEFIHRNDPRGTMGMTAKKFREMVVSIMIRSLKKAYPPKKN